MQGRSKIAWIKTRRLMRIPARSSHDAPAPPVTPAPTVSSVVNAIGTSVGDIDGGYPVTITGTDFVIGATTFTAGGAPMTGVTVTSSTSATATMPAHALGVVDVIATTANGSSPSGGNQWEFFSPAQLPVQLYARGDYAGAPWAGTASAGTSGTRALSSVGVDPTIGAALNGHAPADFDGVAEYFGTFDGVGAVLWSDIAGSMAYFGAALVKIRSAPAPGGDVVHCPLLIGDDGGAEGVAFSSSGVAAFHSDPALQATPWKALSLGAYHSILWWFDGANIHLLLDGAAATPQAAGAASFQNAEHVRVGTNFTGGGLFADMVLEEVMHAQTDLSANNTKIRSYFATRYGVAV